MKKLLIPSQTLRFAVILSVLLWGLLPFSGWSFLNDNDPNNFFDLIENSPQVVIAKVTKAQAGDGDRAFFLSSLKIEEVLTESKDLKEAVVFHERIFPQDQAPWASGQSLLVSLAPLPRYTAYQAALNQGARYRVFGGNLGSWDLSRYPELKGHAQKILAAKSGGKVPVAKRKDLLLGLLGAQANEVKNSGAIGLGNTALGTGGLSTEEEKQIIQTLEAQGLSAEAQRALVLTLKNSKSISSLQTIAGAMKGVPKWAAIRALEDLGQSRSTTALLEDYRKGDTAEKTRALSQIIRKSDQQASDFLRQMLKGSEDYALKREAIIKMAEVGGSQNERVLLEQIQQSNELVGAQAILALGKMSSASSVSSVIAMLKSPSKVLRDAAILSIYLNQDPVAAKYMQERFIKDEHGHFYPKGHFSDTPGAAPDAHGHSH